MASVGALHAARLMLRVAYSPDQPRDDQGQWTAGGSATSSASYDQEEKGAIDQYVGNQDPPPGLYVPDGMNGLLRGVNRYSSQSEKYTPAQEAYYRQQIDQFQRTIEKTVTVKDQVFYRGVDERLSERLVDGALFTDQGFTSITTDRRIAKERFTGFGAKRGRVFEVRIPKGTPLLDVDYVLNPSRAREYTTEREHVLGHGTRFRVKGNALEVLR